MSLEQQVAALVDAANNLTNSVNNKVGEIDSKVLEAVKAIPELGREWHVDAIAGNDEGLGTETDPLETMKEAMRRSVNVPFVTLVLRENQIHKFEGEGNNNPYWEVPGALRIICREFSGKATVEPTVTTRLGASAINFLAPVDNGSVFFQDIKLDMPHGLDEFNNPKHPTFSDALFSRAHQGRFNCGSILFARSEVNLSPDWPLFFDRYPAAVTMILHDSNINDVGETGTGRFVSIGASSLSLAVQSSVVSASLGSWQGAVKGVRFNAAGVPLNVVSNVNFTQGA